MSCYWVKFTSTLIIIIIIIIIIITYNGFRRILLWKLDVLNRSSQVAKFVSLNISFFILQGPLVQRYEGNSLLQNVVPYKYTVL